MIGTIFYKNSVDWTAYANAAEWCNNNNAHIVELADCYEVVSNPLPTIGELKERKLEELSASFNARVAGSFHTTQGFLMQFDVSDSIKMRGAIDLLKAMDQTSGYLVQANDVMIENVSIRIMEAVLVEMQKAYSKCHKKKQEYRAQINACNTASELDSIVFYWEVE